MTLQPALVLVAVAVREGVSVWLLTGVLVGVEVGIGVSGEEPDGVSLADTSPGDWVAEGSRFADWSGLDVADDRGVQLDVGCGVQAWVAVRYGMTGAVVQVGGAGGVLVRVQVARR
jgi:hypothetical protein